MATFRIGVSLICNYLSDVIDGRQTYISGIGKYEDKEKSWYQPKNSVESKIGHGKSRNHRKKRWNILATLKQVRKSNEKPGRENRAFQGDRRKC